MSDYGSYPDEMTYFINHIQIAVAISVLQIQTKLKKSGHNLSIIELCEALKEKRVNWRARCSDLENQVQCLLTQICTSNHLESQEEIYPQSFTYNKFADTFRILKFLPVSEDVTSSHHEDIDQYLVGGIKVLEDAIDNPYWADSLLKTCGQILGSAYSFAVDFVLADVDEHFVEFVTRMLHEISTSKDLNQHWKLNRVGIVLSSVITGSNLLLVETALPNLFQQTQDKLNSFTINQNSSDFEITFNLLEIGESIMKHALINSETNEINSLFIKLLNSIHKIYELSLEWPLINYRVWQIIELFQNVKST